jgi:hypothetical protein
MQWECVVFKDGKYQDPVPDRWLWNGGFSVAHSRGKLIKYIEKSISTITTEKKYIIVIPCTDGNLKEEHMREFVEKNPDYTVILGTLGQSFEENAGYHYMYLPLDDGFFENGIMHYFPETDRVPWNERINKVYWRGGCSGEEGSTDPNRVFKTVRVRTVEKLINFEYADVKLNWWWSDGKNIPPHYFGGREPYTTYMKYKMNLIIDGNVIASSHMWAFASGAVPLLVSNATCWFSKYLKPFVNYIPIEYDLSDLQEKIRWVIEYDVEAEQIAKNALEFANTVFSAEFQQKYVKEELEKLIL